MKNSGGDCRRARDVKVDVASHRATRDVDRCRAAPPDVPVEGASIDVEFGIAVGSNGVCEGSTVDFDGGRSRDLYRVTKGGRADPGNIRSVFKGKLGRGSVGRVLHPDPFILIQSGGDDVRILAVIVKDLGGLGGWGGDHGGAEDRADRAPETMM